MNPFNLFTTLPYLNLSEFLTSPNFSLSLSESYKYEQQIGNIGENKPADEPPEGKIQLNLSNKIWRQRRHYMRLAYLDKLLKFRTYGRTDLDTIFELSDKENRLPLAQILQVADQEANSIEEAYIYNNNRRINTVYHPDKLKGSPIKLEIEVYDEKVITDSQEVNKLSTMHAETKKMTAQLVNELYVQQGFESSLIFVFKLTLKLKKAQQIGDDETIWLDNFSLNWPYSTSLRQLRLAYITNPQDKQKPARQKSLLFNPEKPSISWGRLPLQMEAKEEEDEGEEIIYKSQQMWLMVEEPAEFFDTNFLEGSFKVTMPMLLSGMHLEKSKWAEGLTTRLGVRRSNAEWEPDISQKSDITVGFKANILELFQQRKYSPFQMIYFPDLVLNDRRIADILNLLNDLHFRFLNYSDKLPQLSVELNGENGANGAANGHALNGNSANGNPQNGHHYYTHNGAAQNGVEETVKKHLIYAEREEGAGKLQLWFVLEGESAKSTREKSILGDHTFKTDYFSGNTSVYIRGQLSGDSDRVIDVISDIHTKLKERFRHVSTVK